MKTSNNSISPNTSKPVGPQLEFLIPDVIASAYKNHLTVKEALKEIANNPKLIPVAVHTDSEPRVIWLDIGDYHFKEWKFRNSVAVATENQNLINTFTAGIDVLSHEDVIQNSLSPSGFIFHMSRCGSTLLIKALGQLSQNVIINEGTPLHEGLWKYMTDGWNPNYEIDDEKIRILKHLILSLGRKRRPEHSEFFIKFRSWNVHFINTLMRAFPNVPCIFLYRDPAEVIVSAMKSSPGPILRFKGASASALLTGYSFEETENMDLPTYTSKLYTNYLRTAINANVPQLRVLNYSRLSKSSLNQVLSQGLALEARPEELSLMQEQFNYYSKDDSKNSLFASDVEEKQNAITAEVKSVVAGELNDCYRQLEDSHKHIQL